MKSKFLIFSLLLFLGSCNNSTPKWLQETHHSISPDGDAIIYVLKPDTDRLSVNTWVKLSNRVGGAGVFDIKTNDKAGIVLSWISDSTVQIEYPIDSEIIRQEDSTYFYGRTIKVVYKRRD